MFPLLITYISDRIVTIYNPICDDNMLNNIKIIIITIFKAKRIPIHMLLIRKFAIRNELQYSGFVLPNVQTFLVQKISFASFGDSIDDFLRDTLV